MKRVSFILLSVAAGLLMLYSLTAVLRQNNSRMLLAEDEAASYAIIDIGTLGGSESVPADINNAVEIGGSSTISGAEGLTAFLWQEGIMIPLTDITDLTSQALAINDQGLIVGTAISVTGETANHWPVLWAGEKAIKLATPDDTPGVARAINNQGLIAGNTLAETNNQLLLWQGESVTTTIPISGAVGWANGLNEAAQLVGTIEDGPESSFAFLWQEGSSINLGTLGGSSSAANDINDAAQIVGSASISGDLSSHAFLWVEGEMQDLGGLGDLATATSEAKGINNSGMIVGQAQLGDEEHAVMWYEGQIVDLNSLLQSESDWDLLISAEAVNDGGWITGTGLKEGQKRAFLLHSTLVNTVYLPMIILPDPTPTMTPTPTVTAMPTETPTPSPTPSPTPIPSGVKDMADFMIGDGTLYEVWQSRNDSQARYQTQEESTRFFHTKGNEILAEWEELWIQNGIVYRGTDTSPGEELYYTLYASQGSQPGSAWSPRYWKVGDIYRRNPYVVFFRKSDCHPLYDDNPVNYLKFEAFYNSYTFESGITLQNVIELVWLNSPDDPFAERYFYAAKYGLVGWRSWNGWHSHISEIHTPGSRPDNRREIIPCMGTLDRRSLLELDLPPIPNRLLRRIK